tara:strand:- start:1422 stop:1865 length:444 start_codon:yes stop_codon:yes gene_type:complete
MTHEINDKLDSVSLGDTVSVNENNDDTIQPINKKNFDNFIDIVERYFDIENEIEKIQYNLSEKRKSSKDYYKQLLEYMDEHKISNHNSSKGHLKYEVKYEKERLNNKIMKSKLAEYFGSSEKGMDCYKFLDKRNKVEKIKLKIYKNK